MATVLLFNSKEAPRGVYMLQGLACFVTQYSKTKQLAGHGDAIARFVPRAVTDLLAVHATVLLPIQQ